MKRSPEIYLLRHGQTVWNTEQRLQGQCDSPLTEIGRSQARHSGIKLRQLVSQREFKFHSSPLGRCRETSTIVADTLEYPSSLIKYDERLMELSYGRWAGQTMADLRVLDSALFEARAANRWDVPAPEGESYSMVAARLRSWLDEQCEMRLLVVVGHGCAGRILRGVYCGLSTEAIHKLDESHTAIYLLENGSATRID